MQIEMELGYCGVCSSDSADAELGDHEAWVPSTPKH